MKIKNSPERLNQKPYPFQINHLTIPENPTVPLEKLNSWWVLEFFRIEALRRCDTVHSYYKKDKNFDTALLDHEYHVGWHSLVHEYHHSIFFKPPGWLILENPQNYPLIYNDRKYLEKNPKEINNYAQSMVDYPPYYLTLTIDGSFPPERIIKQLRPLLKAQYQNFKGFHNEKLSDWPWWDTIFPFSLTKNSPIRDIKSWLDYLKCYDLRRCKGLTYGQIALKIYGKNNKDRDLAEKAYKRVTRLIECAENRIWPPTGIK